ncbi:MAG TPA: cyclopropane-fatty-acyl-phospholipid synthase family protein [Gaiellales bacterium]|nr:cyclopropane-fatty-acyl-phospholipid synthase family protein [Gaiellales bacterium]
MASRVDGLKVLVDALGRLPVTVRFWDDSSVVARDDPDAPVVLIRDEQAIAHFLRAPNQLGLGRAWVSGALDVDGDLERVLGLRQRVAGLSLGRMGRARLAAAALLVAGPRAVRRPPIPASEAAPAGRLHSLRRDRASVRHHYDVSNRFYELLLGPSLVYSCAYFAGEDDSLESAQERKLELICRKLRLQPGERLLDIGCGWGSLVLHAAAQHGVRALGVTLSEPQAELARRRIEAAGLADRAEVRVLDYREIDEELFDKIASVGMYEHVGRAQLATYVEAVHRLLRPGGLFLNHGITRLNALPPRGPTFISRYVFPDGELHPVNDILGALESGGFEIRDVESLREHYALTLRRWLANLAAHRDEAVAEIGTERERVWRLYMLGSAQGFETGEIGIHQTLAAREGAEPALPLGRGDLLLAR